MKKATAKTVVILVSAIFIMVAALVALLKNDVKLKPDDKPNMSPEESEQNQTELPDGVSDEELQEGEADIPPDISKMMESQKEPLEAYEALRKLFKVNADGSETYPDDFAGTWIEGSKLIVAVTSDETKEKTDYTSFLKGYDCVEYVIMEYSLNDLENIRAYAAEKLSAAVQFSSHYVDQKNNKIVFGFLEFDEKEISGVLSGIIKDSAFDKPISLDLFVLEQGYPINLE